eukprot:TRINITY_DN50802_c0_g1_i4.p2 TRINITY_DN50802_c0_g1~~TRINITY_DN50802_c0_g1_i4.p2  ORF type:complete len:355 (-),score=85.25 TRINITY_DN50802_c0_g1_i4:21-1085(-)
MAVDVAVGADGQESSLRSQLALPVVSPLLRIRLEPHCRRFIGHTNYTHPAEGPLAWKTRRPGQLATSGLRYLDFHLESACNSFYMDEDDAEMDVQMEGLDEELPQPFESAEDSEEEDDDSEKRSDVFVWFPHIVSTQVTLQLGCGRRSAKMDLKALGRMVATIYEDNSVHEECQITVGLKPSFGQRIWSARQACLDATGDACGDAAFSLASFMRRVVRLLGYEEGSWLGGEADVSLFSNNFTFAAAPFEVLEAHGRELTIILDGDAARQPYYRIGNGLNVGLFGAVDTGDFLRELKRGTTQDDIRSAREKRAKRALAMTRAVVEDSLKYAIVEVLLDNPADRDRRLVGWWQGPR